jgi:hypothetical protein
MNFHKTNCLKTIGGFALLLGMQGYGLADSLAPPYNAPVVYVQSVYSPRVTLRTFGTVTNAWGSATVGTGAGTYVSVQGQPCQQGCNSTPFWAGGSIAYYFEYTGSNGTLPIDLSYQLSFAGDYDHEYENVSVGLKDPVSGFGINYACAGDNTCFTDHTSGSVSGMFMDTLSFNTVYEVDVEADVNAQPGGVAASAFASSLLALDPSFSGDPSSVTLLMSDGVSNDSSSSAPEPGSIGLIAAGGAGIAVLRVRRRRSCARGLDGHIM